MLIVDNGASHRGETAKHRLQQVDARLIVVHTFVPARWCTPGVSAGAITQRQVRTPNDGAAWAVVRLRLVWDDTLSNQRPTPW